MYLDTAIIVKLLVREPDSEWFDKALRGQHFDTSELALAEVRSALLAKERAGHVTSRERLRAGEKLRAALARILDQMLFNQRVHGSERRRAGNFAAAEG